MRVMVLGAGNVGLEVATRARARGWQVVATTTTPGRVEELTAVADEVAVLVGSDAGAVHAAADGCDAILVAASPRIMSSVTVEDRARTYREVLVASCESAAAACARVVFLSSISTYGDGTQAAGDELTEDVPRTTSDEPSSIYFAMAEDAALAAGRGAVLRLADVHGHPRDIDYTARVRMVHEHMGGTTAFSGAGKLHRVHVEDVARAVLFVLDNDLTGTYNCVPDLVPALTNQVAFDLLADRAGLPHIEFRDELRTPTQQVSSAKLRAAGFTFEHPDDPLT
jgi:nucleoside-diphosphate-sugar epimerase